MRFCTALCISCLGCSAGDGVEEFRLDRFAQGDGKDVLLNERLVFKFNGLVDPASVNFESVSIATSSGSRGRGRLAKGRFKVEGGREVVFWPDPVLDPSLQDGGYLAGEEYEVRVAGFPRPGAVRSLDGRILARGVLARFRVVDPARMPEGLSSPFLEERGSVLFRVVEIFPVQPRMGDAITIRFSKPVRPDTLAGDSLRLFEDCPREERRRVPLRLRLERNEEDALVSAEVLGEARTDCPYRLEIGREVRDFSGNPVFFQGRYSSEPAYHFFFLPKKP